MLSSVSGSLKVLSNERASFRALSAALGPSQVATSSGSPSVLKLGSAEPSPEEQAPETLHSGKNGG